MDGLSAAASVIAAIQISGKVFDLCRTYYLEVRDAREDIKRLRDEVTILQDVLTNVADLAKAPGSAKLSILGQLNQPDGPLQQCGTELQGLATKLELGQGKDMMKQFGLRALKWPFSSKDIDKTIKAIERYKVTFSLALTADQMCVELFFVIYQSTAGPVDCLYHFSAQGASWLLHSWLSWLLMHFAGH